MYRLRVAAFAFAGLSFSYVYAPAVQLSDPVTIADHKRLFLAGWDFVINQYKIVTQVDPNQLFDTPAAVSVLSEVQLEIGGEHDIDSVYAYYKHGKPTVHVSMDFIIIANMASSVLADSFVEAMAKDPTNKFPELNIQDLLLYSHYLAEQVEGNRDRRSHGLAEFEYKTYFSWLNLSASEEWQRQYRLATSEGASLIGISAQAFVIGHEIGHIVLGHVGGPIGAEEEEKADDFSAELNFRADLAAFAALGDLIILDYFERREPTSPSNHPTADCRAARQLSLTLAFLERVEKSATAKAISKYAGGVEQLNSLLSRCKL